MAEQRDGWAKAEVISKIVSALFLPIALLWLGTWLSGQQRQADAIRDTAQRQADAIRNTAESNANRLTLMLKSLSSDSARERLLATKVTEYFGKNNQLPGELVPVLLEIAAKDPNKEVSDGAFQSASAVAQTNKDLAPTIEKELNAIPARVYIQIANESQRDKAGQIRAKLIEKNFLVPGIENVSGKAEVPKNTNVRFFNEQDRTAAETVVGILHSAGITKAFAYPVSGQKARPGTLEIWFSQND